ncbi:hypothetical protein ACFWY6_24240 [Streptomyces sp. NPDC059037]|uniref:hypothetical protein n=1 Tax=Streptomyces sp. NPDC059037 TaxID=3346710 RepID=UPI00367497E9
MGWKTEQFGMSHEGRAGAVLANGTEPEPMHFDTGSSGNVHKTSDWWVYDGTLRAPQATDLRGSCSCGWRGTALYPIDWSQVSRRHPYEYDASGPYTDWAQHISEVEERSVPLPDELAGLLEKVDEQLTALADQGPVAALKAVVLLERITKRIGRDAAANAQLDEVPWDSIAKALGLTEREARSRLINYSYRH